MPTTATDNRSAAADAVIDAAARRWQSRTPSQPKPGDQLSPTELRASVGFLGHGEDHVRQFHNGCGVLGGSVGDCFLDGGLLGHPVGRRLQSRLLAAGHRLVPVSGGVSVVRKLQSPSKFSREDGRPHPLVAGFRIEHALRHLTTDAAASDDTKRLATQALHGPTDDAVTMAVAGLHDSLQKDGHPLHGQYNWLAASQKIHTDAAVGAAVGTVAARSGHSPFGLSPEQQALNALDAAHHGRPQPQSALAAAAAEALAVLRDHLHPDDIRDSLQRHRRRQTDAWLQGRSPEEAAEVRQQALDPERTLKESVVAPGVAASRYGRQLRKVRRQIHPLVRGTRLSLALKELTKDRDGEVAALSKTALRTGDGTALGALHDKLDETDHPFAGRYNWRDAGRRLQIDAAVHPVVGAAAAERWPDAVDTHEHHNGVSVLANSARDHLDRCGIDPQYHYLPNHTTLTAAKAAADAAVPGEVTLTDLRGSLMRLARQQSDAYAVAADHPRLRRESLEQRKQAALSPEPTPSGLGLRDADDAAHAEATRFRFDRGRDGGADFLSALRRLRSREQRTRRQLIESIAGKLKLKPVTVTDALSDHPKGSIAAVAASTVHRDAEKVKVGAAWAGLHLQLPSLLVFRYGDGDDRLHAVDVGGSGEKVRAHLDRHGVHQRVLLPRRDGWRVLVYDAGGKLSPQVAAFAAAVGSRVRTKTGAGELIGADSEKATADGDSRRSYRGLIREYEQRRLQERQLRQQQKPQPQSPPQQQPLQSLPPTPTGGYSASV
jgi:hypothetical protein